MADQKGETPTAPVFGYPRSDRESAIPQYDDHELRRKKRLRLYAYIGAFAVFQVIVILVFGLVFMRARTPDVVIRSAAVEGLSVGNSSYNMTLISQVRIKNKNFGDYKYEGTTVTVTHGGVTVGEGVIWKGKAKSRDTQTISMSTKVSSNDSLDGSKVSGDISSGFLMLESHAKLKGKVHLMKLWGIEFLLMKKRKGAEMNCTIAINLNSKGIRDIECDD